MALLKKKTEIKPQNSKEKINPRDLIKQRNKDLLNRITLPLEERGVEFFTPSSLGGTLNIDTSYLTLPSDLTCVNSQELGIYLNNFTQQRMYLRTLLSWQIVACEEAHRTYAELSAPLYKTLNKKDFPSETSKEKYIQTNEEVLEDYYEYRDKLKSKEILELNIESCSDAIFLISREISRRQSDFENRGNTNL